MSTLKPRPTSPRNLNLNLTVYRAFPATPNHVWSPFVNKLELRLRLDSIPYSLGVGNPRQAPRGKIPYIITSSLPPSSSSSLPSSSSSSSPSSPENSILEDTTLITQHLIKSGILTDLNARLSPAGRAQDLAVRSLLEDKLYFYQTRERWVDNFHAMREGVLGGGVVEPFALRVIVGNLAFRGVTKMLWGQGAGRYTDEEAAGMKGEVWEGLSALLEESRTRREKKQGGDGPFWVLGRDEPTEADATVYGFVVAALVCDAAPESRKIVRSYPVLVDYARRIHEAYFSDYGMWDEKS
ncbi:hypothetical protein QBC42DRAFT_322311 [Cladorrhinum samala]|uniref:Thioredoxin-like fold domain-containing protein n=1 Tax=Cladorrhinum samala TaxID=585594 RepID=A0AAV9H7A4_9PEZI|nr:hypothetical protein QBC42DRAFT_322311 [Cladorrhinum samala]